MSNLLRSLASTIDEQLRLQDRIPLLGQAPPFDLEAAASLLKERLGAPSLALETAAIEWRTPESLQDGLGSQVVSLPIALTPLASQVLWMMPKEDIARLSSWLLHGHAKSRPLTSDILQEGFYRYACLQALDALQELDPFEDFSLKIASDEPASSEGWYCIDVKIKFERKVCWGRIAISKELLSAWQRHFSSIREFVCLSSLAERIEIALSVQTGSLRLSQGEWSSVKPGDFLPLERSSSDISGTQGRGYLCLGSAPLFVANLHELKVELIDWVRSREDFMEQPPNGSQEEPVIAVADLPLVITVSLAQLRMTVAELMKLAPGNFLDLPLHPSQEVVLSVNGRAIGKGELVSLGDAIGVRVLETA